MSSPDEMRSFVEQQGADGGDDIASERISAPAHEAAMHEEKRKLERMLLQGLDSGAAFPLSDEQWQTIRETVNRRLSGLEPR